MSMTMHVKAFIEKDETFMKMKKIWDACREAKIDPPDAVHDYFQDFRPDDPGIELRLKSPCLRKWSGVGEEGYEVVVEHLPKQVKVVRFYNAW